jgi:hypothetical protein
MEKVSVRTVFRPDQPIDMWPDEAESLRLQGLISDTPAGSPPVPAAKPAAKPEPAAK